MHHLSEQKGGHYVVPLLSFPPDGWTDPRGSPEREHLILRVISENSSAVASTSAQAEPAAFGATSTRSRSSSRHGIMSERPRRTPNEPRATGESFSKSSGAGGISPSVARRIPLWETELVIDGHLSPQGYERWTPPWRVRPQPDIPTHPWPSIPGPTLPQVAVAQDALHQAEPATGHQAVPAARAAGASCQPAAGAGCQPVDPAPQAPPSLVKTEKPITNAAAPSGAADAAGSVEFLNLDDGRAGAGTDAGRPGHRPAENPMTRILDGMQELRDGMGGLEAALAVMAPAMATKVWRLETAMEKMFKRLDDMEEKVQSLQHGRKVVPEGAAEGAAEDHEGEASGPVSAHSMDADSWRARYANEGETSEFQ